MDRKRVRELVAWLRSTTTETVIDETIGYLQDSEPEDNLWAAAALTAARYINNQAHNMLGFVSHAMIGAEDARRLAQTQDKNTRHMLLIQSIYQVVFDMHDPCMGPYELFPVKGLREATVEENIRMLRMDARIGEFSRCDHRFVALEQDLPREALINLLLEIGLEGMTTDDHTFISPVLCLGMIELVGWEDGFEMLRGTVRYNASFPRDFRPHDRAVALREKYGLVNGAPGTGFDASSVDMIRRAFHAAQPADRPELAARFMAEGHSAETVLSAVSLAGCDMYLMAEPVPHQDFDAISREVAPIHIGTCISALRASMPYLTPGMQALVVIRGGSQLERGPSVLNKDFEFVPFVPSRPYPYEEDVALLKGLSPQVLLETLNNALIPHDYRMATAAVKAYELAGADPAPLIALLTQVACTDNITILHNFKHLNSMVKEFYLSQHPDRWNYLIAAARFIAWYAGVKTDVYERARLALDRLPA
ncbi:MAG: hypothetical protein NZ750_14415 [Anaerolineae bacterium]|nr:hypothetical protein [Anaerolineae bacterium]MDW8170934.1 hypothetical protein [Anaerolineae bacterium]